MSRRRALRRALHRCWYGTGTCIDNHPLATSLILWLAIVVWGLLVLYYF